MRATNSSGWHGLVIQSSAPLRSAAHAVGHLGGLADDQDREPGQRVPDPLDVVDPAQDRVQHHRVQPHGRKLVRTGRIRQRLVIPAQRREAALEHRQQAAVVVDKCDPYLPSLGGH